MTQPLAIVYFERPLLGNQLVHRLQDLNFRVQAAGSVEELASQVKTTGVMLVLADVDHAKPEVLQFFRRIREDQSTNHLPIIGFAASQADRDSAQASGCTMAVDAAALLGHLPAVLEQALRVD